MKGRGTTDAIFNGKTDAGERILELKVSCILVLWIWRKLLIGFQRCDKLDNE